MELRSGCTILQLDLFFRLLAQGKKNVNSHSSSLDLSWINCEARIVYRRKQKRKVEKCPLPLVFQQQLMLLAVSKKRSGPKTPLSLSSASVCSQRSRFLTVSRKNIFKCVWLLNANLHNRWMSSMVLHQENAPLFQYAKSKSFSPMSLGISLPQTALSFFKSSGINVNAARSHSPNTKSEV